MHLRSHQSQSLTSNCLQPLCPSSEYGPPVVKGCTKPDTIPCESIIGGPGCLDTRECCGAREIFSSYSERLLLGYWCKSFKVICFFDFQWGKYPPCDCIPPP